MLKRSVAMLAIASLALTVSCKKENAAERIDDNAAKNAEIAHAQSGKIPVAKFDAIEYDFGKITQGEKAEHTFKVTNAGTADLIINDAKPGCGCTVSDFTKTPIKPGDEGQIKVTFDSKGKSGPTSKSVTVKMNTENDTQVLTFKADIAVAGGGIGVTNKTK